MTIYKEGQKIKITTIVYGAAVYSSKGDITNSNSPGIKYEDIGIIDSITIEGTDRAYYTINSDLIPEIEKQFRGAVKFRVTRGNKSPIQIYPIHETVGKQTIEILEDVPDEEYSDVMSLSDIFQLIKEIDKKEISKALVQELVLRAYDEGRKAGLK